MIAAGSRVRDRAGERSGRLVVIGPYITGDRGRATKWRVRCDCGTEKYIDTSSIGKTKSCGCARSQLISDAAATHRMTKTATYRTWAAMVARCHNPGAHNFRCYGAAGIVVCQRWRESFQAFLSDMGVRPDGMSIDRFPNRSGNYEPGNCRWATEKEQNRNRRDNRELTWNGRTQCLTAWANELCIPFSTLWNRLDYGWSVEKTLSTPRRTRTQHPENTK